LIEWRELAAYYANTSDMKHKTLDAKYITLDELLREVMPLLSASAMNTTLEIPPKDYILPLPKPKIDE
jgi:hypothetical protein